MKHWLCTCGETWSDCHASITVAIPAHAPGQRGHVVRIANDERQFRPRGSK